MKNEKVSPAGKNSKEFDLEDRLVGFACLCLDVCDLLPNTKAGQNLQYQLSKSGTAGALIYGEAQAAESKADFIHKMKMVLKEIKESNELVAIFLTSVETAKTNDNKFKKDEQAKKNKE